MGLIEPHALLLRAPREKQLLYKIMTIENLIRSILGEYLYFNRVDSYKDLKNADPNDGEQLPLERIINERKDPSFSGANYYDRARSRTYACCFSLENSDFIWRNYGKGGKKGKVCLVFDFGKLRATLNQSLQASNVHFQYNGHQYNQIFDINYGLVDYVRRDKVQSDFKYLRNPIEYTYIKDKRHKNDNELRISLSAPGWGYFKLNDGALIVFPSSLFMAFDFRTAINNKTIVKILAKKEEKLDCFEFIKNFRVTSEL